MSLGIWYKGAIAGQIGYGNLDWNDRRTEIGYWLGASFQGKGLVTKSCRAMTADVVKCPQGLVFVSKNQDAFRTMRTDEVITFFYRCRLSADAQPVPREDQLLFGVKDLARRVIPPRQSGRAACSNLDCLLVFHRGGPVHFPGYRWSINQR